MTKRTAGILLHPTSLPGRFGIGDMGPRATRFLDWASDAGQRLWQILPLNPTSFGNSPYGGLSAFAGNPLLISPERLVEDGLLRAEDLENLGSFNDDHVDFEAVAAMKLRLVRESWNGFRDRAPSHIQEEFLAFISDPAQKIWLDDWALFRAIKHQHGGAEWTRWEAPLLRCEKAALARSSSELFAEIEFHRYVQFVFYHQWARLRRDAHDRGIRIMGDVPIYVAFDSADVWMHRELFHLDENGQPSVVAGVPPDYFSETGQRWGNPLYRWDLMAGNGFRWWIDRLRANLRLVDLVRLDHFRAFAGYWEIPANEPTAVNGHWKTGPGIALFEAIRHELGELPIIAEDLGHITHDVDELRHRIGAPGMKVLQFGFSTDDNPHLPHHYVHKMVAYTGTHDNDTSIGWFRGTSNEQRVRALDYLGGSAAEIEWQMIRSVYSSVADTVVVPLQDVLGLDSSARMNVPGDPKDNWTWRVREEAFTSEMASRLRRLAEMTGRMR